MNKIKNRIEKLISKSVTRWPGDFKIVTASSFIDYWRKKRDDGDFSSPGAMIKLKGVTDWYSVMDFGPTQCYVGFNFMSDNPDDVSRINDSVVKLVDLIATKLKLRIKIIHGFKKYRNPYSGNAGAYWEFLFESVEPSTDILKFNEYFRANL